MPQEQIIIIGGGVVGITTALYLHERGYATKVITQFRPDGPVDRSQHPEFASLFPAACIVPHSVEMTNLLSVFDISQKEFARLASVPEAGVRWQSHYELTASQEADVPEHARALLDMKPFKPMPGQLRFDQALGRSLSGWSASVLFAETPIYLRYLYNRYSSVGGGVLTQALTSKDIESLKADIIVNCSGIYARSLFSDRDVYPTLGHLLFVDGAPFPPLQDGSSFSYNYKPPDEEYMYDVYFFPRRGNGLDQRGWLLGGSRAPADPALGAPWRFPPFNCPFAQNIPRPMIELNRKILRYLTGVNIDDFKWITSFGYRPSRLGGVRLELSEESGRAFIHNYGHGGAGVALSWGCAEKVYSLLRNSV